MEREYSRISENYKNLVKWADCLIRNRLRKILGESPSEIKTTEADDDSMFNTFWESNEEVSYIDNDGSKTTFPKHQLMCSIERDGNYKYGFSIVILAYKAEDKDFEIDWDNSKELLCIENCWYQEAKDLRIEINKALSKFNAFIKRLGK